MAVTEGATAPRRSYGWIFWLVLGLAVVAGGYWFFFKRDTLPPEVRIAAGAKGGLYHKIAQELALRIQDRTSRTVRVLETHGSVDNRERLLNGDADLAVFQAGAAPMDGLAGLAPLYPDVVFVIVRKGSRIRGLHDIAGRAVS